MEGSGEASSLIDGDLDVDEAKTKDRVVIVAVVMKCFSSARQFK